MSLLRVEDLACGYDKKLVLKGINFSVDYGQLVGIVGPNGSGKTTLLRSIAGLINLENGSIKVKGEEVRGIEPREAAKRIAFVPQLMEPVQGFSVEEMVLLGRTPYLDRLSFEDNKDYRIAERAIEELKLEKLQDRDVTELSGGEFQRVAIARAVAQQTKVLLLDEPTAHLDIRFQMRILRLLRKLREGRGIVATFHNLNMAARYCQRLVLINKGEVVAVGRPSEVLTSGNIKETYRIKTLVRKNPRTGRIKYIALP